MAALPTVSHEDVAEAAAKLEAQGKPISGGALRAALGRGRPDRLFALYGEMRQAKEGEVVEEAPAPPVLPPVVAEAMEKAAPRLVAELAALVGQAWAVAHSTAEARVKHEIEAARAEVARISAENREAMAAIDLADADIADLRVKLEAEIAARGHDAEQHTQEMEVARNDALSARAEANAAKTMLAAQQDTLNELVRRVPVPQPVQDAMAAH